MKKLILSGLVLVAVSFYSFVADGGEDKFARAVYEAVKSGKLEEIKKHVVTPDEFIPVIEGTTFSPEKKESMKKRLTQEFYDKETLEDYNEIQEKVKTENITWSNAVIDSVVTKREMREGMDVMRFSVYFTSNKKPYSVSASKVSMTKNGWKLANGFHLNSETRE